MWATFDCDWRALSRRDVSRTLSRRPEVWWRTPRALSNRRWLAGLTMNHLLLHPLQPVNSLQDQPSNYYNPVVLISAFFWNFWWHRLFPVEKKCHVFTDRFYAIRKQCWVKFYLFVTNSLEIKYLKIRCKSAAICNEFFLKAEDVNWNPTQTQFFSVI